MTDSAIPLLSVVMPVKNALPYLDDAVESILNQSFSAFEFVIRDDGSNDGSRERLHYWAARDQRIRLHESDTSLGPAGSSNWVARRALAPVVARMDADDISHPHRLERQIKILESNSDAVLVGSLWEGIDRRGRIVREPDLTGLVSNRFSAPFAHGSIMVRRQQFEAVGGYRGECDYWEDLDLYLRMARLGRVLVATEALYQHRFADTSTRLTSSRPHVESAVDLMFECRKLNDQGADYTTQLAQAHQVRARTKKQPNTLLSLGFITLWSGHRPPTLAHLIARGDLRANKATMTAIVWAVWALISPRTLRFFMRTMLRCRNRNARRALGSSPVCDWQPYGPESCR